MTKKDSLKICDNIFYTKKYCAKKISRKSNLQS